MKIYTLDETPRVIYEDASVPSKQMLIKGAMDYGIRDFKNADFSGFHLDDIHFKNCNFDGALFDKTELRRTIFDNSYMANCKFIRVTLYNTLFLLCTLDNIRVEKSHFGYALMNQCSLKDANLVDLGMSHRGYHCVMTFEDGRALIRGGCREMTLKEAKEQYPETANNEEGARVTLARRIAYQRGWLTREAPTEILLPAPIVESVEEETKEEAQAVNA